MPTLRRPSSARRRYARETAWMTSRFQRLFASGRFTPIRRSAPSSSIVTTLISGPLVHPERTRRNPPDAADNATSGPPRRRGCVATWRWHGPARACHSTRMTCLLLALVALAGCEGCVLDSLVFFPDRDVPGTPPPGVSERWIDAADGVRLHAWYAGPSDPPATLLWSHGNAGNIAGRVDVQRALAARGLGVLAYDYRGYGRSTGQPSEAGASHDAEAAFDALASGGIPARRIVCFGESLGGAVSIDLATRRPCGAVAVVST